MTLTWYGRAGFVHASPEVSTNFAAQQYGAIREPFLTASASISTVIDWSSCSALERDASRVSGAWVFLGTRVPIAALFENLEDGASIQDFVLWFPGVALDQVRSVLERAARSSETVV